MKKDEEVWEELRGALLTLNMEFARKAFPEMSGDEARLVAMHKARYEITSMPAELRHESRAWLEKFGYHRYQQLPWPPEEVLPE